MKKHRMHALIAISLIYLGANAVFAEEADWASAINKAKFDELQGNYDSAETQLQDSVDRARTVPDKRAEMFSNLELGSLYASWNKPNKAEAAYEQAFENAKNTDPFTEAFALHKAVEQCQTANCQKLAAKWQSRYDKLSRSTSNLQKLDAYMDGLRKLVRTQWIPPTRETARKSIVTFIMSDKGRPQLLHLERSSGDKDEDARAIEALANAAPYQHLPEGSPKNGIAMEYTFEYRPAERFSQPPLVVKSAKRYGRHRNLQ